MCFREKIAIFVTKISAQKIVVNVAFEIDDIWSQTANRSELEIPNATAIFYAHQMTPSI